MFAFDGAVTVNNHTILLHDLWSWLFFQSHKFKTKQIGHNVPKFLPIADFFFQIVTAFRSIQSIKYVEKIVQCDLMNKKNACFLNRLQKCITYQ